MAERTICRQSEFVYGDTFFEDRKDVARASAVEVAAMLFQLLEPTSVVDVGCAKGEWLYQFLQHGVQRVFGIDGTYVDKDTLEIPPALFMSRDLVGLRADEVLGGCSESARFDLALSLEVAEHLPESAAAEFVALLTSIADIVAFSAAVPGQHGVGHVNCQWPPYWIEKFHEQGYQFVDAIRPRVWQKPTVANWYQQNIFLFAPTDVVVRHSVLAAESHDPYAYPTLIDPRMLWKGPPSIPVALRQFFDAVKNSLRYRYQRTRDSRSRS